MTRVLKGCVKAADWGTRDSVEWRGGWIGRGVGVGVLVLARRR